MVLPTITFDPTAMGRCLTLDEIERIATGKARVSARHTETERRPKLRRLDDAGREQFEHAKRVGYWFDKPENVAWLAGHWSETMELPDIEIRTRGKHATVRMDLVMCSRDVTVALENETLRIEAVVHAGGGRLKYAGCYTLIERVPIEAAPELARRLRDLWNLCVRQAQRAKATTSTTGQSSVGDSRDQT